jgi:YesN/AraC family two-component response regulator
MLRYGLQTTTLGVCQQSIRPAILIPADTILGARHSVILLAEDEAIIRNLVTLLMQREGHFVLSAADGQEGLELSRKYPGLIHLLITDINMPRMNGTDLYGHLMAERPKTKVLVMSGADMRGIARKNANLPFLPKPFDAQTLKTRVREILATIHAQPKDLPLHAGLVPNSRSANGGC